MGPTPGYPPTPGVSQTPAYWGGGSSVATPGGMIGSYNTMMDEPDGMSFIFEVQVIFVLIIIRIRIGRWVVVRECCGQQSYSPQNHH